MSKDTKAKERTEWRQKIHERLHAEWNPNITAWLLLTPALVCLLTFTVFPIFRSLYLSMCKYTMITPEPQWIGLKNYIKLFTDSDFWQIMLNTLKLAVMTLFPSMVIGLMFALLCNRKNRRSTGFMRTAFFYPVVLPMIVIASIFGYIYMARQGLLDSTVVSLGGKALDVLSSSKTALPAIAVLYVWREAGYLMIFYLSGLQNINEDLYEAARLDGASPFTMLRKITLPMLGPTLLFVSTVAISDCVTQVDPILMMTNGGPNESTATLMFQIYKNGFVYFDQGVASAQTMILLVIMLVIAMSQFVKTDDKIHYR